jgi:hypothetical protein
MSYSDISDDQMLQAIGRTILEEEQGVALSNPTREAEFAACAEAIRKVFTGHDVKIRATPHEDLPSVGTIEVTGRGLTVTRPYLFGAAGALAHNYEFYSRLDGTVVLAFTFYNMTSKI